MSPSYYFYLFPPPPEPSIPPWPSFHSHPEPPSSSLHRTCFLAPVPSSLSCSCCMLDRASEARLRSPLLFSITSGSHWDDGNSSPSGHIESPCVFSNHLHTLVPSDILTSLFKTLWWIPSTPGIIVAHSLATQSMTLELVRNAESWFPSQT